MSFFVREQGDIYVQAGTPFPGHCPHCPAYVPLAKGMIATTELTCWNCGFRAVLELFVDDDGYEFTPARKQ